MIKRFNLLLVLGAVTLVGACSNARENLGLNRQAPDEFAVVKRAPLSLPPNYQLRPPQPGASRPQETDPFDTAQEAVLGNTVNNQNLAPTQSESVLLRKAGAQGIDPNIRNKVDSETEIDPSQQPVAKRLLNIGSDEQQSSVVDAQKEAERLRRNAEEGRPVTDGETPSVIQ